MLGMTLDKDLSSFEQHGLLTFGAVLHEYQVGTVAYLPSTPTPEWVFEDCSHGIEASYSTKVASRVELLSRGTYNTELKLKFALHFPRQEQNRFRVAYLCQSRCLPVDREEENTCFVDEIGFAISGNFTHKFPPAYLFVPPLRVEVTNGMHCISYPLPDPLFFWTIDPAGKAVIPEEEWQRYGIPDLELQTRLGACWVSYPIPVGELLRMKGYESTHTMQYVQDHSYPELILGDPHDQRMEELRNSETNESTCSGLELASIVEPPMEPDPEDEVQLNSEDGFWFSSVADRIGFNSEDTLISDSRYIPDTEEPSIPQKDEGMMTRWVKRLGFLKNAYISPSRDECNFSRAGGQETERKEIDSDTWSLVDREDYSSIRVWLRIDGYNQLSFVIGFLAR
ncbi:hypothetical protein PM082_018521 [Marasmius tenuissimus]|nr:hypothetical protein PM082_018521 [Marasmius tenuissimus]